jgi:probable F420-dependent oxidoreductase
MFHEILVLYGFIAALAPRLELVTSVVIAPQRETLLLAKQVAELDLLTNGRLRLGLGIGHTKVEYEALGMNYHDRGKRFEEQVVLLRRLWTEPEVTFSGEWHQIDHATIRPLPIQRPIPIWIGAATETAVKRAVRLGDGFLPERPFPGGWELTLAKINEWRRDAGRSGDTFGIQARIDCRGGTAAEWREAAERWRVLGATHLAVSTLWGGLSGPREHLERFRAAFDAISR